MRPKTRRMVRSLEAVASAALLASCATTSAVCPQGARLADEDRPSGRVEFCATTLGGPSALPLEGRTVVGELGVTPPPPMRGGLQGPYTHWYPDGAVESHGDYASDGAKSVATGVWEFWYPDGSRKTVGRYDHGEPRGCFAVWDERGNEVTGVVEGDHLAVQSCDVPVDAMLAQVEARSHPRQGRPLWGDISLEALAQSGTFGLSNSMQKASQPSAKATVQLEVRKNLGSFRVGPALGYRMSDTDDAKAYTFGAVAAYALPVPSERFGAEVQLHLGAQYFAITARSTVIPRTSDIGIWAPLAGARLGGSFAINPTALVVAGASVEGTPSYTSDQSVEYLIGMPTMETWTMGGVAYGVDVGLRLRLR